MDAPAEHRTLIVANLTASTPFLLQEVSKLAAQRPTKGDGPQVGCCRPGH